MHFVTPTGTSMGLRKLWCRMFRMPQGLLVEGGRVMAELKPCPFCGNKIRIIVCDDEETNTMLITRMTLGVGLDICSIMTLQMTQRKNVQ